LLFELAVLLISRLLVDMCSALHSYKEWYTSDRMVCIYL